MVKLNSVPFIAFGVVLLLTSAYITTAADGESEAESETFFEIDVRKRDTQWPIRFGVQFWDFEALRYKKLFKSLGPVFNTGHWPTLWEVSASAPAPHNAGDEIMDAWVGSIYRNLQGKADSMKETCDLFANHSVEIIGYLLGPPEAYDLSYQQKEYRAQQKAEEEGVEVDPDAFYFNEVDKERLDDFGKFYAASVDHVNNFGAPLPYLELIDNHTIKDHYTVYASPEDYIHLIKRTRQELDARGLDSEKVKIMGLAADDPGDIVPYLEELAGDKEAYDSLYAISAHIIDRGSLSDIEKAVKKLRANIKKIIPKDWDPKPVVVTGFRYDGPPDLEYHDMWYNGNVKKCYDDKYQRTNHMVLKDAVSLAPWFAVRLLAGLTLQMSHGLPWVNYIQGADQWWERSCLGLLDRDDRPKQILAAFETLLPYFNRETYAIQKQWKNLDGCYISAYRYDAAKTRIILSLVNTSPKVCDRSFSLKGIDLWDIRTAKVVTYNNGTVSVTADKPYRALKTHNVLHYEVYDSDEGPTSETEVEFDLVVGPYAAATVYIDAKASKKKKDKPVVAEQPDHTEL